MAVPVNQGDRGLPHGGGDRGQATNERNRTAGDGNVATEVVSTCRIWPVGHKPFAISRSVVATCTVPTFFKLSLHLASLIAGRQIDE